jgi:hypothetical protein
MRITRFSVLAVALVLLVSTGALARGIHSLVETVSGKAWDGKLEQGETLRISINAHGIDFAKSVKSSTALVEPKIVERKNGAQNLVGGVPMGQVTVELKAASSAPLGRHTITVVVGPNPFYDLLKDSEEPFAVQVQPRGTGPAPVVAIAKEQRDAVLFVANLASASMEGFEKSFYEFVTFSAEQLGMSFLQPNYRKVHLVKGKDASLAALTAKLNEAASAPAVKVVDLIFVTHGLSDQVTFIDGRKPMDTVKQSIVGGLSASDRAKLRVVFSTACFGQFQREGWTDAGFKVASGSKGVYADSGTSFPAFLTAWAAGQSFTAAVKAANDSDPLRVQDKAAVSVMKSFGTPDKFTTGVDSVRVVRGNGELTINTMQQ